MQIHLIRHAHAGHRSDWDGADITRPLESRGQREAEAIAGDLAAEGIDRLWSSAYVRCCQTLEPLASKLDLDVVVHHELTEGGSGAAALDLLLKAAGKGHTVAACSHGDVIPAVVAEAVRRGATLDGPPSPAKAARYVLTVKKGEVTKLVHVARPEV